MFTVARRIEKDFTSTIAYDWETMATFNSVEYFKTLCGPEDSIIRMVSMLMPGQWKIINGYKWKREL